MKLTKFHITDYGPLPDRGSKELADFNLFYGKNESGKTLTIDALIKFLIGTTFRQYIHLDRIEARPEGFVKLKQGSTEIKLKDNKKISDLIDISNQEFGKLFIIRDSDLAFSEKEEFYKNITDTLLGLRLNDIEDILSNINDRCNLTPTGMFSDRSPYKLKTKIETAEDTISEIESLITKLKDEDFDVFEEQITRKRYEKIGLEDELNHYREAQKRELYEKSKTALDKYVENEEIIKNLEIFSDKSKTEWIEQKETLKNVANNYNSQKEELEQKESYIQQLRSEIAEKSQKIEVPKKIKSNLDEAIKLNLNAYKKESVGLKKALEKETLFRNLIYISAIIFFALLLSGSISSQLILDILSFVFLIICICMIIILYMNYKKKGKLAGNLEEQKLSLSRFGIYGENYGELMNSIDKFENSYQEMSDDLKNRQIEYENLEKIIRNLKENEIPAQIQKIEKVNNSLRKIKEISKVETLDDYSANLDKKHEAENIMKSQISLLDNLFSINSIGKGENFELWTQKIEELKEFEDKSKDYSYKDEIFEELSNKLKRINEEIENLEKKINSYRDQMRDIEVKVNDILALELEYQRLYVNNIKDLKKIIEGLDKFIKKHEKEKNFGTIAIDIFNQIKSEEKQKITVLLGEESSIKSRFKKITNDNYQDVTFNIDSGEITVENKFGDIIPANSLSGGTLDQLFFAVRVGIGELFFKDNTGFFILDDPFIKADYERLKRLLEMLKNIVNVGWQILYFTSKLEVKDLLKEDIERGTVKSFEFEEILSDL